MTTASLLRAGVAGSITVSVILGAAVPAEALNTEPSRDAAGRVIQPSTTKLRAETPIAKLRKTATTTTVPLARVLTSTSGRSNTAMTPLRDAAGSPAVANPTVASPAGVSSPGVVVSGPFNSQSTGTGATPTAAVVPTTAAAKATGSTASKSKKGTTPLLVNGEPYTPPPTTAAPTTLAPTTVPTTVPAPAPTTTSPKKGTPTTVVVTPTSATVAPVAAAAAASSSTTPPGSSVVITPAYPSVDSSQINIVNTAPPTTAPAPSASTTNVPAAQIVFVEPTSPAPDPHPRAAEVVAFAMTQIGVPYVWAGDGVEAGGFDCSGLTMRSWAQVGIVLTHQSGQQFLQTARVSKADLRPGDLVFFGSPIHHVGLYVGDGKMIEAPRAGANVRLASINRRDLVGAGRIVAR